MKVYFAGRPDNHHYFLKTIDNNAPSSLLRFDNHADFQIISVPSASYVSEVIDLFYPVIWVNKPDHKDCDGLFMTYGYIHKPRNFFTTIHELCAYLDNELNDDVVIDVDSDVLFNHPYEFGNGLMSEDELSSIIKFINSNKNIKYAFFASPKELALKIMSDAGITDLEFHNLE